MLSPSAKHCQIVFLFLTAFTLLINCQQVDLNGPLLSPAGRRYYCVDDELVFTCNGSGILIQWAVPSLFTAQGFLAANPDPLSRRIGGVDATINLQQTTPTLVTNLTIRNVPDITVECFTDVVGSINTLSLNSSTTPTQVQDVILDVLSEVPYIANISWTPVNGAFDLKHYRVQVCVNGLCTDRDNTTRTSLVLGISDGETVLILTESQCGDVGTPSSVVLRTIPACENMTAIIILAVICCVLAISLLVVLGFCIKYYRDVKKNFRSVQRLNMNDLKECKVEAAH